jgi:CheY-like chemotaxis protein
MVSQDVYDDLLEQHQAGDLTTNGLRAVLKKHRASRDFNRVKEDLRRDCRPVPVDRVRLLVVEDNEKRVRIIREWLTGYDVEVVWAKSAGSAIGLLLRDGARTYAGIMLDHDLTGQNMTERDEHYNGKDVVQVIIDRVDRSVPVFVHSSNITEAPRMHDRIKSAGFPVEKMRFSELDEGTFARWIRTQVIDAPAGQRSKGYRGSAYQGASAL